MKKKKKAIFMGCPKGHSDTNAFYDHHCAREPTTHSPQLSPDVDYTTSNSTARTHSP